MDKQIRRRGAWQLEAAEADSGSTKPTVSTGILCQVLLVVVFRVIKCRGIRYLGGDAPVTITRQDGLVLIS